MMDGGGRMKRAFRPFPCLRPSVVGDGTGQEPWRLLHVPRARVPSPLGFYGPVRVNFTNHVVKAGTVIGIESGEELSGTDPA